MKLDMSTQRKNVRLKEGFEKFIREKRIMNVSSQTIKAYQQVFNVFMEFYGPDEYCHTITKDDVYSFIEHKKELAEKRYYGKIEKDGKSKAQEVFTGLSDETINHNIRHIRAVLYFFMENGYMDKFKINNVKATKSFKEPYSDAEMEKLLKKPNLKTCKFSEYRNWVIINYLIGTGNRLTTLCNVKIKEVDFENSSIILSRVKNRNQYIIPLSETLEEILKEYLKYRKGEPDDYLFCTQFGEQLTKSSLESAIYRYNRSKGVEKTSIHLFRHYFAKSWILNGGDVFRLQRILGHSSLDIVRKYVNIYGHDLNRNFNEFNPLDKMNLNKSKASKRAMVMKK